MAYDNSARAARARRTRADVVAAAHEAFLDAGYAGTTIRAVAERAGVSPETVYKGFGNKATLLKAVYDVAVAGDGEPVPMAERPDALAVRDASGPRESARAYAAMAGGIVERAGPLTALMAGARGTDPDLDAFAATLDRERLAGATAVTGLWSDRGWLRSDLTRDRARDVLWTLIGPAVHHALVGDRGWDRPAYEGWLADTVSRTLLRPS